MAGTGLAALPNGVNPGSDEDTYASFAMQSDGILDVFSEVLQQLAPHSVFAKQLQDNFAAYNSVIARAVISTIGCSYVDSNALQVEVSKALVKITNKTYVDRPRRLRSVRYV